MAAGSQQQDASIDAAARRLASSALPLFAGLGVDVTGARAAVVLAERLGGAVDHMHSAAMLRDLDPLRESGAMRAAPTEIAARADLVFVVGEADERQIRRLTEAPLRAPAQGPRRIVRLARDEDAVSDHLAARTTRVATRDLPVWLVALRARAKGRPVAGFTRGEELERIADALNSAKFGVAVWSAAHLGAMEIEALNGLARDLNETTRFTCLPLAQDDNAPGVLAACGWTTGFPMRTGFGPLGPEHDPWRFDAARMIAHRESDCVIWISAFGAAPPRDMQGAIDIAICDDLAGWDRPPPLHLAVGRPGRDHNGVLHDPGAGALVAVTAQTPRDLPDVAAALAALARRIDALHGVESVSPC